jgi:hypothetical protein
VNVHVEPDANAVAAGKVNVAFAPKAATAAGQVPAE